MDFSRENGLFAQSEKEFSWAMCVMDRDRLSKFRMGGVKAGKREIWIGKVQKQGKSPQARVLPSEYPEKCSGVLRGYNR